MNCKLHAIILQYATIFQLTVKCVCLVQFDRIPFNANRPPNSYPIVESVKLKARCAINEPQTDRRLQNTQLFISFLSLVAPCSNRTKSLLHNKKREKWLEYAWAQQLINRKNFEINKRQIEVIFVVDETTSQRTAWTDATRRSKHGPWKRSYFK